MRLLAASAFIYFSLLATPHFEQKFPWAVIGAGPAGIVTVAVLLQNDIPGQDIVWIDQEFNVGRLGKYYGNVPSNQKAYRHTHFLHSCPLFVQSNSPSIAIMEQYNQQEEPPLQLLVNALADITYYLKPKVTSHQGSVRELLWKNDCWQLSCEKTTLYAQKVILASGSHPKRMDYEGPTEIPLDAALDKNILAKQIEADDVVAVIGSAHSALLILKYLAELQVKKVVHIYSKPPSYGTYGGLEGVTARWAKEVWEHNLPAHFERAIYNPITVNESIKQATKIVYAYGYEPNQIPVNGSSHLPFDCNTGVIMPYLYGIGIAFPKKHTTIEGNAVDLIGINSFMAYAQELIPKWMKQNR